MITDINSEDRLIQKTFADHLHDNLGWESAYACNAETFGPKGTLGRASEREAILIRDPRAAIARLNPDLPASAREQAVEKLTHMDFARSLLQHNREFYGFIQGGVPVEWKRNTEKDKGRVDAEALLDGMLNQELPAFLEQEDKTLKKIIDFSGFKPTE